MFHRYWRRGAQSAQGFLSIVDVVQCQRNVLVVLLDVLVELQNTVEYGGIGAVRTGVHLYYRLLRSYSQGGVKAQTSPITVSLTNMLLQGSLCQESHEALGAEESIALLGHRTGEAMGAADVFLEGIEVTQYLGAEVTLKKGIRQAG
ncbi:hypothetical protein AN641_00455 [Candidatus Epulonipiscioides gigas]|nr:hypothetical protein AN641_00455 [Epulopiscium sp. SCG-C07WGA-EpuloA2]